MNKLIKKRTFESDWKYAYALLALMMIVLGGVLVNSVWISSEHSIYHDASDVKITIDGQDYNLQEVVNELGTGGSCSASGSCSQVCIGNDCATDLTPNDCSCIDADGDGHYPLSCTDLDCSLPRDDCDDTDSSIYTGPDCGVTVHLITNAGGDQVPVSCNQVCTAGYGEDSCISIGTDLSGTNGVWKYWQDEYGGTCKDSSGGTCLTILANLPEGSGQNAYCSGYAPAWTYCRCYTAP